MNTALVAATATHGIVYFVSKAIATRKLMNHPTTLTLKDNL
jgi:hypothetical protein